jgi:hypothetical protein
VLPNVCPNPITNNIKYETSRQCLFNNICCFFAVSLTNGMSAVSQNTRRLHQGRRYEPLLHGGEAAPPFSGIELEGGWF